jgi:multicomponent Na+:H+ antiporter subunit G
MLDDVLNYAAAVLVVSGSFFALIGAIGIIRFPDLYSRSHAASKAGTVGSGLCMIAIALCADDFATSLRAIAGVLFFLLTAPIAAHLLMRAAYKAGYPLWQGSVLDEMPK